MPHSAPLTPYDCFRLLSERRRQWITPTLVCTGLAVVYALFMTRFWEATQAMVVRREVSASTENEPGKFVDLYEMRTFQETLLELARSQQVVSATLQAVSNTPDSTPSDQQIDTFRKRLSMLPPGGAEFGKTEVFYIGVKDPNRERAKQLVAELCRQIDTRLRELRTEQAQSVVDELEQQVEMASAENDRQTRRLMEFEAVVGADLGELRMLNASASGQSDLRQQIVAVEGEARGAEVRLREAEQLLEVLLTAQQNPERLVAMPSSLLASQPTLRRLKEGLVVAQLRAAQIGGTRTAEHPQVQASRESVAQIRKDLHGELAVAIQGLEIEIELASDRSEQLAEHYHGLQHRLVELAGLRADYANRISAVENSRKVLEQTRKQLGEVRSAQVAASTTSLIKPVDAPETGPYQVGLGRTVVTGLGAFGGLVLGIGWVFLAAAPVGANPSENGSYERPVRSTSTTEPRLSPEVSARIDRLVAAKRQQRTLDPASRFNGN